MKPIQKLISVLFCLAIFFLPVVGLYAQQEQDAHLCCVAEQKQHCQEEHSPDETTKHNHCERHCTLHHHCVSCFAFIGNEKWIVEISDIIEFPAKQNFTYKIPYILSLSGSIWQPPKIG